MTGMKTDSLLVRLASLSLIAFASPACDATMIDDDDVESASPLRIADRIEADAPGDVVAAAYPTRPFGSYFTENFSGYAWGSVTWYNRSVGIQGEIVDYIDDLDWTRVTFRFFHGATLVGIQHRTAESEDRSFNFTQGGPVGGILSIDIEMCEPQSGCEWVDTLWRP